MATTILRSCRGITAHSQMRHISKTVLACASGNIPQYQPAACLVECSVRTMASSSKQDELFRQITIELKGHDTAVLNSYEKFTSMAAKELGVQIARIFEPPRIKTRMSLMKSVFVHKKHFHQYEMRTMYRVIELKHLTGSTAGTFLEYIQRNLPEGVAMKVTKHQLEKFPEHIKPPKSATKSTELDNSSQGSKSEPVDRDLASSNVDTGLLETSTPTSSPSTGAS